MRIQRDEVMAAQCIGPVRSVAVLSDVHGNVPALDAVLAEDDVRNAELVMLCGDLTWGPEPMQTFDRVQALGTRLRAVKGNADRAVVEFAKKGREPERARDSWMPAQHSAAAIDFLEQMASTVVVDILGLGRVRFCHGSPRDDTELVTSNTPTERYEALAADVNEQVIVHGHTHLQFDRQVARWRSVGPGSVGLPYHDGETGTAYWALLGPDVSLRQTTFDVSEAVARTQQAGDPSAETIIELLLQPPGYNLVLKHAEGLMFSD